MNEQTASISHSLKHSGMKGSSGEEVIRGFLRTYLPGRYKIGQGKVVDFQGNESKQTDIIIMDAAATVPFYVDAVNVIVPIEAVYATIEVKTSLVRKSLNEAVENTLALRTLALTSRHSYVRGGLTVERKPVTSYPASFVIGLSGERSSRISALYGQYVRYLKVGDIHFPVLHCCAVLGKGFFFDYYEPDEDRSYARLEDEAGDDTLLLFFLSLIGVMEAAEPKSPPPFDLYLNGYNATFVR